MRTPRAAAIAGIVFAVLLIASLWLLRLSTPSNPLEIGSWLSESSERVNLALNLIPFAGVAFMWFLGVLRDRLGPREDKFFATVFLGSGLMFLGMLFVAAAVGGGLIRAYSAAATVAFDDSTFIFARAFSYDIMHIYAFNTFLFSLFTYTIVFTRCSFVLSSFSFCFSFVFFLSFSRLLSVSLASCGFYRSRSTVALRFTLSGV